MGISIRFLRISRWILRKCEFAKYFVDFWLLKMLLNLWANKVFKQIRPLQFMLSLCQTMNMREWKWIWWCDVMGNTEYIIWRWVIKSFSARYRYSFIPCYSPNMFVLHQFFFYKIHGRVKISPHQWLPLINPNPIHSSGDHPTNRKKKRIIPWYTWWENNLLFVVLDWLAKKPAVAQQQQQSAS